MTTIDSIEPRAVFRHFKTLSSVPHCSNDEAALSETLVEFAKKIGLKVTQDNALNVVVEKPASPGYGTAPRVILQGHIDMVCAKHADKPFDFKKDGLDLHVEDGYLKADGTTLGADNGIAVAMIMAILEDETLAHPPLTALFTVGEEIGMIGVSKMKQGIVSGDILINLDAEEEGVFFAACAGGVRSQVDLPLNRTAASGTLMHTLHIVGLKGGHSGLEIDKGRGNAIHLLGRVLETLNHMIAIHVHDISGGEKMNAIAKFATATISIDRKDKDAFERIVRTLDESFKDELSATDPDVCVSSTESESEKAPFDASTTNALIALLRLIPTGISTMSFDIPGLVESSNTLGVLSVNDTHIVFESAIRSSKGSLKEELANRIACIANMVGARASLSASYPEWPYQNDSPIREQMLKTYEALSGESATVSAVHAGLETGFLLEKIGPLDVVALGPNIFDVHTPNEHLDIASTERVYALLIKTLEAVDASFPR